ncbi:MAG: peptidoglycan-binding domain-containing protein [Candidatus Paceibacterota bacterium]
MKLRILVLVGILAISLPMVLFAQSTTSTSTTSSVVSGCMTISSGDTEVQTLTKQLTCVFNLTESLSVKLKNLEEKLNTLEIKKDITVDNVPVVKKCSNGAIDYPACVIIKDSTIDTEIIDVKVKKCSNGAIDYPACVIIKDSTIDTEIIDVKVKKCSNGATNYPTCTTKVAVDVCKSTIAETKVIQTFLKAEGSFTYPTATGNYGNITTDAVKKFQTKEGITSTGLIDGDTLQKMKVLAPSIAPSISKSVEILCPTLPIISINTKPLTDNNGDTDAKSITNKDKPSARKFTIAETKVIQTFLKAEGSFTYPTATGNYGNITTDAVKKFQTKEGITSTGLIDGDTLQKMKVLAPSIAPSISKSVEILCPTLPIISINTKPPTADNGDVGIPVSN